ncbi:MAG: 3-hydroxyacyl-ACP dehydratase FabZ [Verrucomicrobia bacterium]|nr:3-hydroxyacyl-ACP dehydratase FabZ [Verrucomicrobiota bacterium]
MATLTIEQILSTLPHRYPMLLVDRVIECDDEKRIVGIKNVTANEPFFQGHFPGNPVMPGVLQLEAMAQTGGILMVRILQATTHAGGTPYFMALDNVKFRKVVRPGDQLRIECELTQSRSRTARFVGRCLVDGQLVSEAELMCMIAKESAPA